MHSPDPDPSLLVTVTILLYLPLPPSSAHISSLHDGLKRLDVLGMSTLILTLSFLIVNLNIGGQTVPWDSPVVIVLFCVAVLGALVFVWVEGRAELPVVPLRLFREWKWRNVPIMTGESLRFFSCWI